MYTIYPSRQGELWIRADAQQLWGGDSKWGLGLRQLQDGPGLNR
jgi:hypothetical protein